MDLISREALLNDLCEDREEGTFCFTDSQAEAADKIIVYVTKRINAQPTVDAAPVKHGRWIEKEGFDGDSYYTCSSCGCDWTTIDGTPVQNNMRYCPECGAKMDLEEQDAKEET